MQIKWKPIVIMFFIIYFLAYGLSTCSALKADEPEEPKLTCEAFINEKICEMTQEEQEIWFLELLKKILENVIEEKKIGIDV